MNRRSVIKWVAFFISYFAVCACLARFAPDWAAANTRTMLLVVIAMGVVSFAIGFLNHRACVGILNRAEEYREQGLLAFTYTQHCKVRTQPVGSGDQIIHEAFCGCGDLLGAFPLSDPDKLLKLSAEHMVAKGKVVRAEVIAAVAETDDQMMEHLERIRNAPKKMREEAKRNSAV